MQTTTLLISKGIGKLKWAEINLHEKLRTHAKILLNYPYLKRHKKNKKRKKNVYISG